MDVSIDYLSFTFKDADVLAIQQLVIRYAQSLEEGRGNHGYLKVKRGQGFAVYYDGSPGMGVYLQISGEGCSAMSSHASFSDWAEVVLRFRRAGGVCGRVDFAFDDRDGLLDVTELRRCIEAGAYTSRWSKKCVRYSYDSEDLTENTIYLGRMGSNSSLCIYDKQIEQRVRSRNETGVWVRAELRYKHELAEEMASWIVLNGKLVGSAGFLAAVVTFRDDGKDSNISRRKAIQAWSAFVAGAEKLRVSCKKLKRTATEKYQTFVRQHSANLVTVVQAVERETKFAGVLYLLWQEGLQRQTAKHVEYVASVQTVLPVPKGRVTYMGG